MFLRSNNIDINRNTVVEQEVKDVLDTL